MSGTKQNVANQAKCCGETLILKANTLANLLTVHSSNEESTSNEISM